MKSTFTQRSHDRGGGINAKAALQSFPGQFNEQCRTDINNIQEEAPTCPDTPPFILKSRSTSSSIAPCERCNGSISQRLCPGQSDTESLQNQGSETRSVNGSFSESGTKGANVFDASAFQGHRSRIPLVVCTTVLILL
jgi:hypothetical protein